MPCRTARPEVRIHPYIFTGVADGDHPFQVRAVNAVGKGEWSSSVTFTIGPAELSIVGLVNPQTFEGENVQFTLFATKPVLSSSKPLNVSVLVSESGDMVASADEGTKTVSFALNATSAVLLVPTVDDGVAESNSAVTAAIQTDADYTVGALSSSTVTVSDAEALPGPPTGLTFTEGHAWCSWSGPRPPTTAARPSRSTRAALIGPRT